MGKLFRGLLHAELRSAAKKHYKLDMGLTLTGSAILSIFAITTFENASFGVLFAILAVWHRYVVLNVAKIHKFSEAEIVSAKGGASTTGIGADKSRDRH